MICVIKSPLPECRHLRFEWHPRQKKVWWMPQPAPGVQVVANVLAEHVADQGQAFGFVQTFCRGYRLGAKESAKSITPAIVLP